MGRETPERRLGVRGVGSSKAVSTENSNEGALVIESDAMAACSKIEGIGPCCGSTVSGRRLLASPETADVAEVEGPKNDHREVLWVVDAATASSLALPEAATIGTATILARRRRDLVESCVDAEIEAEMLSRGCFSALGGVQVLEHEGAGTGLARELRRELREERLLMEWLARNVSLARGGRLL